MPFTGIPQSHIKALQQRLQCAQEEYAMSQAWKMFLPLNKTLTELVAESEKSKAKETRRAEKKVRKNKIKRKRKKRKIKPQKRTFIS